MKSRMVESDDAEEVEEAKPESAAAESDKVVFADISTPGKNRGMTGTSEREGSPNFISDVFIFDEEKSESEQEVITPRDKNEAADDIMSFDDDSSSDEPEGTLPEPDISAGVKTEADDDVESKVKGALSEFRDELKQNISDAVKSGMPDSHITEELNINKEELNEFNLLSNMGAANAAESLSKILNKRIDLSIPEVRLTPVEKIPDFFGNLNEPYMGVMLGIEGEINGTLLLLLQ